jgi:NADP-dependent 3-hydroxy acid dehydrogenase YdfG
MNPLSGQVAIVTGASQGIGAIIARHLAAEGIHLVLTSRTTAKLEALKTEIQAQYPTVDVLLVTADVSQAAQAKAVVDKTVAHFGRVDILINNAGVACKISLLQETSLEDIDRTIDINLKGPIYLMKFVLPEMVSRQQGTIININSVAGKTAYPYWSIYDASKFGLRAITDAVAEEQAPNNIKVVGIYPGAVDTPIWDGIELDHAPKREGMLDAETIAESVLYILRQPGKVFIPEITLKPLQPAL